MTDDATRLAAIRQQIECENYYCRECSEKDVKWLLNELVTEVAARQQAEQERDELQAMIVAAGDEVLREADQRRAAEQQVTALTQERDKRANDYFEMRRLATRLEGDSTALRAALERAHLKGRIQQYEEEL